MMNPHHTIGEAAPVGFIYSSPALVSGAIPAEIWLGRHYYVQHQRSDLGMLAFKPYIRV